MSWDQNSDPLYFVRTSTTPVLEKIGFDGNQFIGSSAAAVLLALARRQRQFPEKSCPSRQ